MIIVEKIASDHMPIEVTLRNADEAEMKERVFNSRKEKDIEKFRKKMEKHEITNSWTKLKRNIQEATVKTRRLGENDYKSQRWWDEECWEKDKSKKNSRKPECQEQERPNS
ncbi:hypothetical protein QAD02_013928 [Eretmocerus hayati]|uniref:Uncharacterized protein n=1 Tax=Eretmocerus hayati TaxID=131215 RepID=A0ACC2P3Y0_9HYME|nr:hypothetical protein QAD02_013928 [Eretmocerus hayati]